MIIKVLLLILTVGSAVKAATVYSFSITAQSEGKITSPNFPSDYPRDSEFIYTVQASASSILYLELNVVDMGGSASIVIYEDLAMTIELLPSYCCDPIVRRFNARVDFVLQFTADPLESGQGFELFYKDFSTVESSLQYRPAQYLTDSNKFIMRPSPYVYVSTSMAQLTDGSNTVQSGHVAGIAVCFHFISSKDWGGGQYSQAVLSCFFFGVFRT